MLMHGWESWQPESQQAKGKAVTDGHGWSKSDSNSKSSKGDVLKCNVLERALLSAWWGPPLEASLCPNHCSTWVTLENTEIPVAQGGNLRDLHSLLVPFTIKRYLGMWIILEKAHSFAGVERIGWKQRDPLISDLHNLHRARAVNACLSPARGLTGISRSLGQERWTERERTEQNKSHNIYWALLLSTKLSPWQSYISCWSWTSVAVQDQARIPSDCFTSWYPRQKMYHQSMNPTSISKKRSVVTIWVLFKNRADSRQPAKGGHSQ